MKIVDYYCDENDTPLEDLSLQEAPIASRDSIGNASFLVLPTAALAFHGRRGWPMFSMFRRNGDAVEAISPFGRHAFHLPPSGEADEVGLVCVRQPAGAFSWTVSLTPTWANAAGESREPSSIKAKKLSGERWEPVHQVRFTRSSGGGFREWLVILLPASAESIAEREGRARLASAGKVFDLPEGKPSELALAGKIQWGLPDESGVFVLRDEPRFD